MSAVEKPTLWRHVSEVVGEVVDEMYLRNAHPDACLLRTGIATLDEKAAAAFEPGRLIVLAGSSGGGKTALGAQLAVAFSSQVPTMLVTLEDDERDTVRRSLANVSRESVGAIRAGFAGARIPEESLRNAVGALDGLELSMISGDVLGSPTVEQLLLVIREWRSQWDQGQQCAVIIDQLSHIADSSPTSPFWDGAGKNLPRPPAMNSPETKVLEWKTDLLRKAAQKLGLTIVLAHQLNDAVDDRSKKPTQASIRGSRGITHKADLVMVPWIPAMVENQFAGPGDPKFLPNDSRCGFIISLKARSVEDFEAPVRWIGAQQRFTTANGDADDAYQAPAAPTEAQSAGARKLSALRASWEQKALERVAAVAVSGELMPAEPAELEHVEFDEVPFEECAPAA